MTLDWPDTAHELRIDFDALLSNGQTQKIIGLFTAYGADENAAELTAHVHMRLLLLVAGVPFQGRENV